MSNSYSEEVRRGVTRGGARRAGNDGDRYSIWPVTGLTDHLRDIPAFETDSPCDSAN